MPSSTRDAVVNTYRRRARHYDITANSYYLLGFREWAYRREAVRALSLRPGATVVEIGCGTGLNFSLLQRTVGPAGRIVGVDATDAMLDQAQRRVDRAGWTNVDLVHTDALEYRFPPVVDAVLSTFALSLVPECGQVITNGRNALVTGGRLVVLDLKLPVAPLPDWLIRGLLPIVRPFAVTEQVIARRPWEMIRSALDQHFDESSWTEHFLGAVFLATGSQVES